MARGLSIVAFAVLLVVTFRSEPGRSHKHVRQVAPGVYYRDAAPEKQMIANTGWVVFRDYVVLIDANMPWGMRDILDDLRQTTNKPVKFVFDTHYHGDHMAGNSVWMDQGATALCSADCAAESILKNSAMWRTELLRNGPFDLKAYRLEHPQITFPDSMAFDDGTRRLELTRMGPAHTRGDAVAYLPKERVLFTGDLCVTAGPSNFGDAGADVDHWLEAMDSLLQKEVAVVVPGHGPHGPIASLRGYREYVKQIVDAVHAGIANGQSEEEIAQGIDVRAHTPWGRDAAMSASDIHVIHGKLRKAASRQPK